MSQNIINQHYVPQGHLRLFADSGERFWVYDKKSDRIFGAAVRDMASERYFNEYLPDQPEHFQNGEKYFQHVESSGLPIVQMAASRVLNEKSDVVLSDRERTELSIYLAVQMQRTKESREESKQMLNKCGTALARSIAPPPPPGYTIEQLVNLEFKEDYIRFIHLQSVARQAEPIARAIFDKIWLFRRNRTDLKLWLSDQPVARHSSLGDIQFFGRGLLNFGVELRFPLSPEAELMIVDPRLHEESRFLNGGIFEMTEADVIESNLLQTHYSYRFLFSRDDNFEKAKQTCDRDSLLRNPDRERAASKYLKTDEFLQRVNFHRLQQSKNHPNPKGEVSASGPEIGTDSLDC